MMDGAQSGGQRLGLELSRAERMLVVEQRPRRIHGQDDVAALRAPVRAGDRRRESGQLNQQRMAGLSVM